MDVKNYLISFLAQLKGHKAVIGGLTQMQQQTKVVGTTTEKTAKKTKDFSQVIGNLTQRALLTIPVWLLLRSVFMGIIRTIGDMIRANIHLTAQQLDRLRQESKRTGLTVTELVRRAIDNDLKDKSEENIQI